MDRVFRAIVLDNQARITIIDTSDTLRKLNIIHGFSTLAASAMGRVLSVGAYVSHNIKDNNASFNIIVDGGGILGKIYVAGEAKGYIKAYVENPKAEISIDKNLSLCEGVGCNGYFTLIKDSGLKTPYIGRTQMISGNISDDYAYYLHQSEGIRSAVGLNVFLKEESLFSFGIICEALPGASDDALYILEDIMSQFDAVAYSLMEKGIESTFSFYFGHLNAIVLSEDKVEFKCDCLLRSDDIVKSIGAGEISEILKERETVELICDYCGKHIEYDKKKLEILFGRSF